MIIQIGDGNKSSHYAPEDILLVKPSFSDTSFEAKSAFGCVDNEASVVRQAKTREKGVIQRELSGGEQRVGRMISTARGGVYPMKTGFIVIPRLYGIGMVGKPWNLRERIARRKLRIASRKTAQCLFDRHNTVLTVVDNLVGGPWLVEKH